MARISTASRGGVWPASSSHFCYAVGRPGFGSDLAILCANTRRELCLSVHRAPQPLLSCLWELVVPSKTTIVSPWRGFWSPLNHLRFIVLFAGLAASATNAGGAWVLPDEYSNLGDDLRKNISGFSTMTDSAAKPPVLRQSTSFFAYFLHEGGHGSWARFSSFSPARAGVLDAPNNLGNPYSCQLF